jgi:hypothetical protein
MMFNTSAAVNCPCMDLRKETIRMEMQYDVGIPSTILSEHGISPGVSCHASRAERQQYMTMVLSDL